MSRWLAQIRLAVRSLFRRPEVDQELDEEFQYHLERQIEDNLHRGLAPEEARYAAIREMGPIAKSKEECRDARRVNWMQDLAHDLRYGLRMLRKSAGFTTVAVLTLALGIGVTTAILSIIDPVLFRPLPYANSDRLVPVGFKHAAEPFEFMFGTFYYDWSDNQTVFTEMTAQSALPRPCDLTDRDPMRLTCSYVHQNFLPTLGIRPVVGSNFTTDDMLPDAPLTVMLSYELWKSRYNEQPSIVNQVIEIDALGAIPDEWTDRNTYAGTLVIRSALSTKTAAPWIRQRVEEIDPLIPIEPHSMQAEISTLANRPRFATALLGFFAATGLLMASIGLYGVTAYTAARRTHEIGIRTALGATRIDVLRLIMLEGLRLIFLGGGIGLVAALSTAHLLRGLLFEVGPYDPMSFVCVAVLLAFIAIAAIFVPAMRAMCVDPMVSLRYE